jgi:hypothetical protein
MNDNFVSEYAQAQRQAYHAMNQALEELARIMRDSSSAVHASSNELYQDLIVTSRRLDLEMTEMRVKMERANQLVLAQAPAATSSDQPTLSQSSIVPTHSVSSEQMLQKIRNVIATSTSDEQPLILPTKRSIVNPTTRGTAPNGQLSTNDQPISKPSTPKPFASATETRIGLDYDWSTVPDQRFGMKMIHLGKKYTGLTNWNELYIKVLQGFHDYKHSVFKTRVLSINATGGQFVTSKKNLFVHSVTIGGLNFAIGLLPNQIRDNIKALYGGYDMSTEEYGIYVRL